MPANYEEHQDEVEMEISTRPSSSQSKISEDKL
jgi:hypothetical protein